MMITFNRFIWFIC